MKIITTAVFNLLLLGGLTLSTCNQAKAASVPEAQKIKAVQTELKGKVSFPEELVDQSVNEKVKVWFKIKTDKTIEVITVETYNTFLKAYVKEKIQQLKLAQGAGLEDKILEISLFFVN